MSNEHWRDGILNATTADLVRDNGADFLAVLLQKAVQEQRDLIARHHDEMAAYVRAHRAGLAVTQYVRKMHREGRKSVWVHTLMGIHDDAQTLDLSSTVRVAAEKGAES